jgi:hypothetical protein
MIEVGLRSSLARLWREAPLWRNSLIFAIVVSFLWAVFPPAYTGGAAPHAGAYRSQVAAYPPSSNANGGGRYYGANGSSYYNQPRLRPLPLK